MPDERNSSIGFEVSDNEIIMLGLKGITNENRTKQKRLASYILAEQSKLKKDRTN